MLTFDQRDFTKSALSLAAGMLGVAMLAAWRSGGDIPTVSLTLGLPLGVLAFWGVYSLRMKRMASDLGFTGTNGFDRDPPGPQSAMTGRSFHPKLLHRSHQSALILDIAHPLPRFRCRSKEAPLTWDSQDLPMRDQWYM